MQSQQQLSLSFSCRNLPDEAYNGVAVVVLQCSDNSDTFSQIGQTETFTNNLSPSFSYTCPITYFFEKSQLLRFEICNIDGSTGRLLTKIFDFNCSLAEILSQGGSIELCAPYRGLKSRLTVESSQVQESAEALHLHFKANNLTCDSSHPLNSYFVLSLATNDEIHSMLYKSESVADKNPLWKPFTVPFSNFFSSLASSHLIQIDLYNNNVNATDSHIGIATTTLDQLLRGVGALNTYKLSHLDRRKKDHSSIELIDQRRISCSSFIDFITSGTEIHFSVAVDFTASNGNPLQQTSLHYIHPHNDNHYMQALRSVSNVIGKYNKKDRIAALGFGAQIPPLYQLSHLFYMNGSTKDAHVHGVQGLVDAYRSCLLAIRPYAPTDYSEVIYHVYKFGSVVQRQRDSRYYFILLILTDGCTANLQPTIDAIVKCSYLPLSIVIVGIGRQDYSPIRQLLSPLLKSSDGVPLKREIVTFVPFTDDLSEKDLVSKLLLDIPRQFLSWACLYQKSAVIPEK